MVAMRRRRRWWVVAMWRRWRWAVAMRVWSGRTIKVKVLGTAWGATPQPALDVEATLVDLIPDGLLGVDYPFKGIIEGILGVMEGLS